MVKICIMDGCGNNIHKKDLCYEHFDKHAICKKLGKPINHFHSDSTYILKCTICDVSFSTSDDDKLYKGNKCPCCHHMLRLRKGSKTRQIINKDKGI